MRTSLLNAALPLLLLVGGASCQSVDPVDDPESLGSDGEPLQSKDDRISIEDVRRVLLGDTDFQGKLATELAARMPNGTEVVVGPQGPTGPQGPIGLPGAAGPQGAEGLRGAQGPRGVPGPQGIAGPTGGIGLRGPTGLMGPQGPRGDNGLQGDDGPEGPPGPAGPVGPRGPRGEEGRSTWTARHFDVLHAADSGSDVPLRAMTVRKAAADTALKVTWYDTLGTVGDGACTWELHFSGAACTEPGPVMAELVTHGVGEGDERGESRTVTGFCRATAAGPLPVDSDVTVRVHVTPAAAGAGEFSCTTGGTNQVVPGFLAIEEVVYRAWE